MNHFEYLKLKSIILNLNSLRIIMYILLSISHEYNYISNFQSEIFIELFKNDVEYDYLIDQIMNHKIIDGKHYYYIH